MRNKVILIITAFILTGALLQACKKETFKPVDMSELNPDEPLENTDLDKWLKENFLDPYNAQVIYHYHRYYHEPDRNVSPPDIDAVKPMMTTVLEGYVDPYKKVAGEDFVKKNMPKEWVLYGSTSFDGSGTGYAGTASGGVRINLFGINHFELTPTFVKGRLRVIHHEFTHILNQRFIMPADFPEITKSTYNGDWKSVNPDSAHAWGYVSSYASQNPAEDYAETTSSLLVSGQSWYDSYTKSSTTEAGRTALRLKEQNVVGYFNSSLNIDFRALQKEVQTYIKDVLKDPSVTFPYWINRGLYKTITINLDDAMYETNSVAPEFKAAYDAYRKAVYDWSSSYQFNVDYIQFRFDSPTSLVIRSAFTATVGGSAGTQYLGDYSFSVAVDSNTGEVTFTKIDQADGTTFGNGNLFITDFENTIQKFLTENTFVGEWLPESTPASEYTKTGGFYIKGNPSNYIYGILGE